MVLRTCDPMVIDRAVGLGWSYVGRQVFLIDVRDNLISTGLIEIYSRPSKDLEHEVVINIAQHSWFSFIL